MDDPTFKSNTRSDFYSHRAQNINQPQPDALLPLKQLFDYAPQQTLRHYDEVCQFTFGLLSQCANVK